MGWGGAAWVSRTDKRAHNISACHTCQLLPPSPLPAPRRFVASIAYNEQSSDSSSTKLGGALLNAIIFVCIVGAMTVVLFLLFKYGVGFRHAAY